MKHSHQSRFKLLRLPPDMEPTVHDIVFMCLCAVVIGYLVYTS